MPYNAQQAYLTIDAMYCGKLLTGVMYLKKAEIICCNRSIVHNKTSFYIARDSKLNIRRRNRQSFSEINIG